MNVSLIQFSAKNFKIFKEEAVFSMVARKSHHTFERNGENLLKVAMIYGPNASGKTTLLDAMKVFRRYIANSATKNQEEFQLENQAFLLSEDTVDAPTAFKMIFALNGSIFQYEFSSLNKKINTESLSEVLSTGNIKKYFTRSGDQVIKLFGSFNNKSNKDIITKTRPDVLFLSVASQWNNALAIEIVEAVKKIKIISGISRDSYSHYTQKQFKENENTRNLIIEYLKKADFCISDAEATQKELPAEIIEKLQELNIENFSSIIDDVHFHHRKYDKKGNVVGLEKFEMAKESVGTQNFFAILGPVIDALENGLILLIDEFDNSLHPLLTKYIADLFERKNQNNAQLIVTTHDTSLLSYKEDFDKVQFWFTEKDKYGAGSLFSLAEFTLRNDTEYSKKYLEGRFGALPFIESI